MRDLSDFPRRVSLAGAPPAAVRATSAVRVSEAIPKPDSADHAVLTGHLASPGLPHVGLIAVAGATGETLSIDCSAVLLFANLLSQVPNVGLVVPRLDEDLLTPTWVWQD